jgi:hypothetical protein
VAATPPPTALRIRKGSTAGAAMRPAADSGHRRARTPSITSWRAFHRASTRSASSSTMATTKPLWNSPAIETPATEPSTISTMLGGTVSAIAAPVASSATISFGL